MSIEAGGPTPPPGYPPYPAATVPYGYPQQPLPPGYWPPAHPQDPPTTNGFAIASMVLGIVWLYGVGSILALVFGLLARRQIRDRGQAGDGMAIAGIVLGVVGLVGLTAVIVMIVAIGTTSSAGNVTGLANV